MQYNLYNLPVGKTAQISALHADENIRRRLLDIGLTQGAKATCLYQSPSGNPRAYLIRGAVIALRTEDALKIELV